MNYKSTVKLVIGLVLATLSACGPVSHTEPAELPSEVTSRSNPPTSAADVNRNIAAVSLLSSGGSPDYRIGPEDLLEITLFNVPATQGLEREVTPRTLTVRVTHQGQISLPVVGEIPVKGATVSDLEKRIRDAYDKYIYNPQ